MADKFTEGQVRDFKKVFDSFDKDGNGKIDSKELGTVLKNMGQNPTDQDLKNMIEAVDLNHSGTIEFNEFLRMMANQIR